MKWLVIPALILTAVAAGTGCSNNTGAHDAALQQNEDLKRQLDAEKRRADAAERMAAQVAGDNTQPVTPPGMGGGAGGAGGPDTTGGPLDLSGGTGGAGGAGRAGPRNPVEGGEPGMHVNGAGEVVIELSGDVLFDSGKATLKPASLKTLDGIANTLKTKYGSNQIRVEGYSDPTPVKNSGWDDNYDLAFVRARAVMKYLASKGVKDMYAASFGDSNLKSKTNLAQDRRVDIVVVKGAK